MARPTGSKRRTTLNQSSHLATAGNSLALMYALESYYIIVWALEQLGTPGRQGPFFEKGPGW